MVPPSTVFGQRKAHASACAFWRKKTHTEHYCTVIRLTCNALRVSLNVRIELTLLSLPKTPHAIKCFRVYLCMMPLAAVNKGTFIYLQSLGKAFASTAISMVWEVLFGKGQFSQSFCAFAQSKSSVRQV
mgnify:CR=1 FL=1